MKTCLITGAAGGIGKALVSVFESAGWRVLSIDLISIPRDNHIVGDLSNCSNPDNPESIRIINELKKLSNGNLKAIIHNAAHQVVRDSRELTINDWNKTLSINLLAPFWLTISMNSELITNKGVVLAVSSIHEKLTKPGFVAYSTSKAALSGLIRGLAIDFEGKIRFNAICPAAIATPMLLAGFKNKEEAFKELESHHPSGRIGRTEEVAETALFLCSNNAEFINGACIDISGAISARLHDPV